jgi:hypothetical protein
MRLGVTLAIAPATQVLSDGVEGADDEVALLVWCEVIG